MRRPTVPCKRCNNVAWVYRSGRRFWKCGWCNHRSDRYKAAQRRAERSPDKVWGGVWNS